MADRQTAGGYPKIGYVIAADLPLAGQLAPGDFIEFDRCVRAGGGGGADRARTAVAGALPDLRERVTRLRRAPDGRIRRRSRAARRAARAVDDVQSGRPGGVLHRDAERARRSSTALSIAHAAGVHGHRARRRVQRADRGPRHARPGDPPDGRRRSNARSATRLVRADAAVTINGLVRWTINRGYAGLEAWAGTPGTVGGAIYGNAHWKSTNIGDLVESVRLARPDGTLLQAPADRMEFGYDYSRLKRTGEVVLWAAFRVTPGGDPNALRADRARIAGVPQAHPAARVAERRLHLHESRSGARPGAGRASRRRPARSSIAPVSKAWPATARACRRRTPTSSSTTARPTAADIRAAHRALPRRRERSVRRRPAK